MAKDHNPTPLLAWLRLANEPERARLASLADTYVGYLYLLATCKRKNPSATLALGIEDGTRRIYDETNGRLPIVTVRTIAGMCAIKDLQDTANTTTTIDGDKV